jgi:hypothetical protein
VIPSPQVGWPTSRSFEHGQDGFEVQVVDSLLGMLGKEDSMGDQWIMHWEDIHFRCFSGGFVLESGG